MPTPRSLADGETERLARRLMRLASDQAPDHDGEDPVMFDLQADGMRCVVLAQASEPHRALSPREQEIVRMVSQGYPNKTIAAVLDISTWTVSTHMRRIFAKLGVRNRAAMVARVRDLGMAQGARKDYAARKSAT